ncbi:SDR family oxidoreductase [Streptomyces sp. NPDC090080]|uniref:SDR family oxidoreductase n=1 Tax=Streptomyces sp. NPDC090080 TaxID=3365939 RepID=UPI0038221779
MTSILGSVALVTGGHRGIGKAYVDELLARGAAKVYATGRKPVVTEDSRIVDVLLDVTDASSVRALAERLQDVGIVINNAGVLHAAPLLRSDMQQVKDTFATNVLGPLRIAQSFAPTLARAGGGALVNMHSILSWGAGAGIYGASKAALWSLTNSLRIELAAQHTQVVGVHVGFVDTEMTETLRVDKMAAADVARIALDGVEHGDTEVLVDGRTVAIKAALSGPVEGLALSFVH